MDLLEEVVMVGWIVVQLLLGKFLTDYQYFKTITSEKLYTT